MANLAIESETSNSFMDYEDHPILISLISPPPRKIKLEAIKTDKMEEETNDQEKTSAAFVEGIIRAYSCSISHLSLIISQSEQQ